MKTVRTIISRLEAAGVESPQANAEAMLCSLLGLRRTDLYANAVTLDGRESDMLEDMINRRINGEPLQYITGITEFFGNKLFTEPGVFIPRPETEILVEAVIGLIKNYQLPITNYGLWIFDLGTGTGNVAISLTKALTHCKIISSDISQRALSLAKRNAAANGVCRRIDFIKADLFNIPDKYMGSFDAIVSNPPYICSSRLEGLPADVQREPREALDGGIGGLGFYSAIIKQAPIFLKRDGFLALELADGISEDAKRLFESSGNFHGIRIFKDLNGIDRVIVAKTVNGTR